MKRGAVALLALASAASVGACGDSIDTPVGAAGALPPPSGTLQIALPGRPSTLDPLLATDPSQQLLVRQLFEPLVERLRGPYGDPRRLPGPAVSLRSSKDHTTWTLRLRPGIAFQDGTRLDAAAVLANATRWRTTAAGRDLLPGLAAADSPRPDLVRLFFSSGDPGLRRQLAQPQLALVSPTGLSTQSGAGAALVRPARSGTGPFEVRVDSRSQVVLARNADWWGTARRLGPALDTIELDYVSRAGDRARLVRSGAAQLATALPSGVAKRLSRDPLLSVSGGRTDSTAIALERSVRGVELAGPAPLLSGAWLTTIGAG